MRPSATLAELKAWASVNAIDPLSADVWGRIRALEGENPDQKATREGAEAAAREQLQKLQAKRSRELARERGLRDPARARRQIISLFAAVFAIAAIFCGWVAYTADRDHRLKELNSLNTPREIAAFLDDNWYHPVRAYASEKLESVDNRLWLEAKQAGRVEDLQRYVETFSALPSKHLSEALEALKAAEHVATAQQSLRRLGLYRGTADGASDEATRRYRSLPPANGPAGVLWR
jgi:hypothetical protein